MRSGLLALAVLAGASACVPDEEACCRSDDECAPGAGCFEGTCAPRCVDESQCHEGESCLAGLCVAPLRADARCPFGEKRDPPRAGGDAGVVDAGEPDAGPVEPLCEDPYEPNDDIDDAVIVFNVSLTAAVCPAQDDDWYRVLVEEPLAELLVRVSFEHDEGDLDVELFDDEGTRLGVSQLTGDVEELRLPVSGPREVFIHVYGFGQASNQYTLDVELLPPSDVCLDDALEDNDSAERATPLALDDDAAVSAAFCAGDPDVYSATLPDGARALAVLQYERGDELNLEVRAPGFGILGAGSTFSGAELVPLPVDAPRDVLLRVGGTHGHMAARPYDIGLRVSDGSCGLDDREPNDVAEEARPFLLPANDGSRSVSGALCARDIDVWRLAWTPGSDVVELQLTAETGARAYVVREDDLSLVERFAAGQTITFAPGVNVVSDDVLVILTGPPGEGAYHLRGRALLGE